MLFLYLKLRVLEEIKYRISIYKMDNLSIFLEINSRIAYITPIRPLVVGVLSGLMAIFYRACRGPGAFLLRDPYGQGDAP